MKAAARPRIGDYLRAWASAVPRYPWLVVLLPFAVFFPLLDSRGLYEYGDANFPFNPFWIDSIMPWSGTASAGADNTFIGVPRLVYHVGINALIATTHNIQVSQWLWYSSMTALGLIGAYLLARRLGAAAFSLPLAIFYSMNVWSYDRIAQGPIYLSYQATPLVVYLFLRYLKRPSLASALYFACSLLLVIPSLQVSYLAALVCFGIAVREIVLRGWRVLIPLAWLGVAVVAANGFYVFSMLADAVLNEGGNIALVNHRFSIDVFKYYSANISVLNTLTLQSFFYSSIDRQPGLVRLGTWMIPFLCGLLLLIARPPTLRSKFYAGLGLAVFGVWLVAGISVAPLLYQWFHELVPGMRSFVEPDYFSPIYILGVFVMFASALRAGTVAYRPWFRATFWGLALTGIVPFLPIFGPSSGLPQTAQPRQYSAFSRSKVAGNTLWIPAIRGVQYRWSPYVINGFTSLNSPSDAIGPTMAEWVSRGTARVQSRLADGFTSGQLQTVESLAPLLGVGTVAIAADSLSEDQTWPNPQVEAALRTFDALKRRGFLTLRDDARENLVHLVVGETRAHLPDAGIYSLPVRTGGFENFMWAMTARPQGPYVPFAADDVPSLAKVSLPDLPAPRLRQRDVRIWQFDRFDDCSHGARRLTVPRVTNFTVTTLTEPRCFSLRLRNLRDVAALQATIDSRPPDIVGLQLAFGRNGRNAGWIDPTLPAQEVPFGARDAELIVRIVPFQRVTLGTLHLRFAPRPSPVAAGIPSSCKVGSEVWTERNPMQYVVQADARGWCTVVFRQSFAPIWALSASGPASVFAHVQVDGFANAWIVRADGPVTFTIVNRALYAYVAGMALTIACLLLALGFVIRDQVRWANRRARRVPSAA